MRGQGAQRLHDIEATWRAGRVAAFAGGPGGVVGATPHLALVREAAAPAQGPTELLSARLSETISRMTSSVTSSVYEPSAPDPIDEQDAAEEQGATIGTTAVSGSAAKPAGKASHDEPFATAFPRSPVLVYSEVTVPEIGMNESANQTLEA